MLTPDKGRSGIARWMRTPNQQAMMLGMAA